MKMSKYRVNYLELTEQQTVRSKSLVIDAENLQHAREIAHMKIEEKTPHDDFRITTIKEW